MNASPNPLRERRVALIGYGLAGAVFHAPLIAATPGLRLAAITTSDPERSAQARLAYPGARLIADVDALFSERDAFDLVVIASPNRSHAALARAALENGHAVVIDKPFALTVAEGAALIDTARRADRMLTVFQNRRWDGDFLTLRQLLAEDRLGTVHRFESRFERWRPQPKAGWRQQAAPEEGGGVLYDLGSHLIDQALQLFGPAHSVYAELRRRHPQAQVDDDSFVALQHADGTISHLWMSSMAPHPGARLRVLGARAAYVKHGLDPQEDALRAGARPPSAEWGLESESDWGSVVSGEQVRRVATRAGDYPSFYAAVERSLRTGAPPPVDARDCLQALHVIEVAQRAAREGGGHAPI